MKKVCILLGAGLFSSTLGLAAEAPTGKTFTNSIGMDFVRVDPGTFQMGVSVKPLPEGVVNISGQVNGDSDEAPVHEVIISRAFYLGVCEVTNAQYERFDPGHRRLRGKLGFSKEDDEAVVFVDWHEATRFCAWLTAQEGLPYRLPAEAEWEYACRAGSMTFFNEGDTLSPALLERSGESWYPDMSRESDVTVLGTKVRQQGPNAWGLFDMHGNVEEWCADWYGPYCPGAAQDPVGYASGIFRVTRGGSHSTEPYYLRSANRSAAVPEDKHWLIGFRVALGPAPETMPLPAPAPERHQQEVKQAVPPDITQGPDPNVPYFKGPRKYVHIPEDAVGPMFAKHNHVPALVECPNGDLLAVWYSCIRERGRELGAVASRLRYGNEEWEPAAPFWDVPDRNDHASALWFDGDCTLFHFEGLSAAGTWGNLATILRTSADNGATWSHPSIIIPEHNTRHMPIESIIRLGNGHIVLPCDAVTGGQGGTALWVSPDNGLTWIDAGGTIAGIHAGVVELNDGRLLAFGRGDEIDGRMSMSVSEYKGAKWGYSASPFQAIGGGQRLVLRRLKEGPLLFISFAKEPEPIVDSSGTTRAITGMYAALSYDEGQTWTVRRPISDDGPGREVETMDGVPFVLSASTAEPKGYLAVCQARNGVIHLISSRQHYAFNLAWLEASPSAVLSG
ncbi:MAG: SUMF1/EgtB/PvdO family nonheme iron enzyme [Candidatus Hydrogenedentes bacterium]|nr:SUMF1/EgtB/PvdO family nonheme iron enzyme [Candidatus Hydrogenedentota bacterium]